MSFKENTKKMLLKNFQGFKKRKLLKENLKTCWKKYLQVYQSIQFCIKKENNKQT